MSLAETSSDKGKSQLINDTSLSFAQVAEGYVGNLSSIVQYYAHLGNVTPHQQSRFLRRTMDLYWYDYQAGYSTVFAEFVAEHGPASHHRAEPRRRGIV